MNTIDEWLSIGACGCAQRFSRGCEQLDPRIRRAVIAAMLDRDELEGRLQAAEDGPLKGVPYLAKDVFDARGWQTTASSTFLHRVRPAGETDGALVERLQSSGAVLAGKTHLNEFAYGLSGQNPHFGNCPHPSIPQALSGGSSSGSAYAVAVGLVPFALGTDTGGSIRVPAAFCGLWGVRLVPGLLCDGCVPLAPVFDTVGFLATCAADIDRLVRVVVPDPQAAPEVSVPLRVSGLYADDWVEDGARRPYREAMAGVSIHGPWSNDLTAWMRELPSVFNILQSRAALEVHAGWIESHGAAYDPLVYGRIMRARDWTAQQVEQSERLLRGFRAWLEYVFMQTDVLLMPAVPCPSPEVAQLNDAFRHALLALTTPASLAGLPVLAQPLPCGQLGLQWVCRDMDTLLRLTAQHAGA